MKIRRIRITNLGVYADMELDFGLEPAGAIFVNGNNGRGKTTFINALKWCLFDGARPQVAKSTITRLGVQTPFSVAVEVEILGSDGTSLLVEKSQRVSVSDNLQTETQIGQVLFQGKLRRPGKPTDDLTNVREFLELWFPKRLEDFILFDAEQLANFFNPGTRAAVENAVLQLAGVSRLDKVIETLTSQRTRAERLLSKLGGSNAEFLQQKAEKLEAEISEREAELNTATRNAEEAAEALDEVTLDLARFDTMRVLIETQSNLEAQISSKTSQIRVEGDAFAAELLKSSHLFMVRDCLLGVEKHYEDGLAAGYPLSYPTEVLRELLSSDECVCGCNLDDSGHRDSIAQLLDRQVEAEGIEKSLPKTRGDILAMLPTIDAKRRLLEKQNRLIGELHADVEQLQGEFNDLDHSIATPGDWTEKLDLQRRLRARSRSESERARGLEATVNARKSELQTTRRELSSALKTSAEGTTLRNQIRFLKACVSASQSLREKAIQHVRGNLEDSMNRQYSNIKSGTYHVTISDRFDVRLVNADTQTVSEGEKMSLAYAFAIAIRESLQMELPLVVDSAFGRLSSDNREWLSKSLVQLVNSDSKRQVLFLMHDLEYTPQTRSVFKETNPLEYFMEHDSTLKQTKVHEGIDPEWLSSSASPWFGWSEVKN